MTSPRPHQLDRSDETPRHVRMLTTLLAGCDPCGWVEQGGSPNLYAGVALDVVGALQRGADVPAVVMVLPGDAAVEPTAKFARVAVDWWQTARSVRTTLPTWACRSA